MNILQKHTDPNQLLDARQVYLEYCMIGWQTDILSYVSSVKKCVIDGTGDV